MKRTLLLACYLVTISELTAQKEEEKWNIGVHGGSTQYSGDLGQGFYSTSQAFYGFAGISLSRYLTKRLDASLMVTRGQAGYLTPRDYSKDMAIDYNFRVNLSTANLLLRYNLRDRDANFVPFAFAGGSALRQRSYNGNRLHKKPVEFAVPTGGAGFNLRINPTTSFQLQEMFVCTLSDDVDTRVEGYNDLYLLHTLGLTFDIGKYRKVESSRAGNKIDRCSDMRSGFEKKYHEAKRKTKAKKHHR